MMLRSSATFRSQYQRIADTKSIVVGVRINPALLEGHFRAQSTFHRYYSGLIVVAVSIGPGSHQAEWIAHEFEHILEQLDGCNLPRLASGGARDVWYSGQNMIETARAVRAGHTVRDELRQHPSRSDKLVE